MTGRIAAMAIGFVAIPIVTRIFNPEQFGVAGLVGSVAYWTTAFSCLGYAQAIPLSRSRGETRQLVRLCLLLTLGLLAMVVVLVAVGGDLIAGVLGDPTLRTLLWFVPILFLFASLRQTATYTLSKERKFGWSALVGLSNAAGARPVQIGLGWLFGGSALFLLLATAAGGAVSVGLAACVLVPLMLHKRADEAAPPPSMLDVAQAHQQFPKVQMWNVVLNVSSMSLPILLMGNLFGVGMVGYYNLGRNILVLPMTILGNSVAQVFYPEAATEWHETGSMAESICRTIRIISRTCVFPIVCVAVLGPVLFETVLGEEWDEAGVYAQILSPWILIILLSSPLSSVLVIRRRGGLLLLYNVLLVVLRPLALVVGKGLSVLGSPLTMALAACENSDGLGGAVFQAVQPVALLAEHGLGGPRIALLLLSAAGACVQLHLLCTAIKLGMARRRTAIGMLLKETILGAGLLIPAALAYYVGGSRWGSLGLLCPAAIVRAALLYRQEPVIREKLRSFIDRGATQLQ